MDSAFSSQTDRLVSRTGKLITVAKEGEGGERSGEAGKEASKRSQGC